MYCLVGVVLGNFIYIAIVAVQNTLTPTPQQSGGIKVIVVTTCLSTVSASTAPFLDLPTSSLSAPVGLSTDIGTNSTIPIRQMTATILEPR